MRGTKQKESSYLLRLSAETNEALAVLQEKLGWNKAESIRRSVGLFAEVVKEMKSGQELVLKVQTESDKKEVFVTKPIPLDLLRFLSK
jgi:predicted DNA-binding protein